jgi:FkbM family methyltransferase
MKKACLLILITLIQPNGTLSFPCIAPKPPYYSQCSQDQWLEENCFKGKKNGVFVDVGAYEGLEGSNTAFFAKHHKWTGFCIEPQPDLYELLPKNRPDCHAINACASDKEDIVQFLYVKGLAAKQLSGILELYDSRHLSKINGALEVHGGEKEIISIYAFPLSQLLRDHAVNHVDYLSIDVEGAEMKVLQGIDFESCTFDIISIEVNYDWPELEEFLRTHGFVFVIRVGHDQIWYSKKFAVATKMGDASLN